MSEFGIWPQIYGKLLDWRAIRSRILQDFVRKKKIFSRRSSLVARVPAGVADKACDGSAPCAPFERKVRAKKATPPTVGETAGGVSIYIRSRWLKREVRPCDVRDQCVTMRRRATRVPGVVIEST